MLGLLVAALALGLALVGLWSAARGRRDSRAEIHNVLGRAAHVIGERWPNWLAHLGPPKTRVETVHERSDYRTDIAVVACLEGLLIVALLLGGLKAWDIPGAGVVAIALAAASVAFALSTLGYLYRVVEVRDVSSAVRSLVLGLVNFVQVGLAFGNAYFAIAWLTTPSFTDREALGDPGRAAFLSLAEQFGRGGPDPVSDLAGSAVLAHGASWLFVLVVVIGSVVNALAPRDKGRVN